ncbi:SHOCT domain-containing protein [Robinsoniella sp. KNHs210]|nr:SHOCT domain-containing protein [Robinsoniella sp. KNHs210]
MHIRISLNNKWISNMTIELLSSETKKSSMTYGLMKSSSERIISLLDLIVRQSENVTDPVQNTSSVADEILKFKNLLDIGAITLEEFEAKKKQLLNL